MLMTIPAANIPDTEEVDGTMVAHTPEALSAYIRQLRIEGYNVSFGDGNVPFDVHAHQNYRHDVYATYPALIKCLECGGYVHRPRKSPILPEPGDTCDKCGTVINRYLDERTIVRFGFDDTCGQLKSTVKRWDPETRQLFLKWEFLNPGLAGILHRDQLDAHLKKHQDQWASHQDEDGEKLIVVSYGGVGDFRPGDVVIYRVIERFRFAQVVRVRKDGEFTEIYAGLLPMPPVINITTSY